ncbi:MAG: molybdopterin-binding oxidoreductase [Bryobacterales bacterium]|nr:molybdopterin-binding oxidoreductase [Bryobacterales bacterium]
MGGLAALAGTGAWIWLRSRRPDDEIPWPLRLSLRANEQLARDYFSEARLARTFAPGSIEAPRVNGNIGLEDAPQADWSLTVDGIPDADEPLSLNMADIQSLPKVELIMELKCIEGWSRILKWGGARFQDFVNRYASGQTNPNGYVALETPDREYYVGLDMASALHPQTLLCYEMNGKPLESQHGAPLRLVIPVKYGIKNLKRIGKIIFSETRPPDYWAERGYDYYAGF